jgi:hypothetical protein
MTDTQADLTERARQLRDEVLFAVKDGISINALNKLFDSLTAALQSEREATEAAIDDTIVELLPNPTGTAARGRRSRGAQSGGALQTSPVTSWSKRKDWTSLLMKPANS